MSRRQLSLNEKQRTAEGTPVDVLVVTGLGTRPGVDIADRRTWQHLVDEEDAERFRAASSTGG